MKYPQLVSTRAVNAISDWLVSRLEQLGVEAPLIYSRLLLSLLQSSVQINDPIEFSNLETFLANRKGNNKRYPPCDTNTLRKITAVQCLMEIVSSEQEITNIENLVDELCEKLIAVEKQSTSLEEDDDDLQITAASELKKQLTPSLSSSTSSSLSTTFNTKNEKFSSSTAAATIQGSSDNNGITKSKTSSLAVTKKTANQQIATDVDDPRKRYYRAFPALSKEMEDSIELLRRNTKLLTWPVDRKINLSSSVVKSINSNSSAVLNSNNCSNKNNNKNNNNIATLQTADKVNITICVGRGGGGSSGLLVDNCSQTRDCNTVLCNTAGVKRKSKRRRNQALSKGKTAAGNNLRKHSYCGGSNSPTWDTDFEGSWEMGRDLIKEFIIKQNNRNRSTSESAAYNMAIGGGCGSNSESCSSGSGGAACETSNDTHNKDTIKSTAEGAANELTASTVIGVGVDESVMQKAKAINNNINKNINQNNIELAEVLADPSVVEVSLCENIVEKSKKSDDNNMSDMTEGSLSTARRLYERDISNDSLNEQNPISSSSTTQQQIHSFPQNPNPQHQAQVNNNNMSSLSEQLDFAKFKAKFSNVEALWKTSDSNENKNNNNTSNNSLLQSSIVSDSVGSVVPQRSEDLKNFWVNYYSHRYDVDKVKEESSLDFSKMSSTIGGNSTQNDAGQNNYFSMPIICNGGGGVDEFDKSVGGKRIGGKTSPIGVFLQSTIWSENSNASYPDTDESFFLKVLNSTTNTQKPQDQLKVDVSGTEKSYFYPYQSSKWSEGINAGPNTSTTVQQQQQPFLQQQPLQQQYLPSLVSSSSSSSISAMEHSAARGSGYNNEFADSTTSSSSSYISGNPNWHHPAGNNFQADIKSWSSSNPTSLTELYGNTTASPPSSSASCSFGKKNSYNFDRNYAAGAVSSSSSPTQTKITLTNHSATTSGFLAYSRIKSYAKLIDLKPIAKWQKPEANYHKHLNAASPPDDENLLTSERTHFHPIKMSYADGHTFEISSNLDPVDFERSESGYLYLESEKYLEYVRSDILAEEDGGGAIGGHYQQQQHHSLTPMSRDCTSSVTSTKSSQSEFLIRFRVKNTDQACQTDSNIIGSSAYRSTLSYQMTASSSSHLSLKACNISSANLNESCSEFVSGGGNDIDDDEWMDIGCISGGGNAKDDEECVSMDQWSMVEITKKCMDNNNASHTLWGMCPTCNSDIKSNPANRLLKAELNVEGDEIMSDLRYMQDLYIGNDNWNDQNCTRDDEDYAEDDDDTDLDADVIRDCEFYQSMATPAGCGEMEEEDQQQKDILYSVNKLIADLLRPENAHSLVNALGVVGAGCGIGVGGGKGNGIVGGCFAVKADDGAHGGAGCDGRGGDGDNVFVEGKSDEKYIGGLWNNDENIIWKKEFNPIDIFSRFNNNNNESFLDKLNWEYSNLAEIWEKSAPEKQIVRMTKEQLIDDEASDRKQPNIGSTIPNPEINPVESQVEEEENIKIACRNMKNLLKSSANIMAQPQPQSVQAAAATSSIDPENSAIFEINERRLNDSKRMQCFLNSNKFKISNRFDRKRRHSASQNVCSSSLNNNNNTNYNNNNNNIYDNNNSKFSFASPDSSSTCLITTSTPDDNNSNTTRKNIINSISKATTKDSLTEYDNRNTIVSPNDNDDNDNDQRYYSNEDEPDEQHQQEPQQRQATIITCKYWTTMQPINNSTNNNAKMDADGKIRNLSSTMDDAHAPADSFFIDKNKQFIDGLPSITLNTSSILKHVTLVSRPLTR